MTWYFDVPNVLMCVLTAIIAWRINTIPNWVSLILILFSFTPFFMNNFLLPTGYMNDQVQYTYMLQSIREGNLFNSYVSQSCPDPHDCPFVNYQKPLITGLFLSILPVPFIESINSFGFFNRFLFMVFFIWLYHKKFLKGLPLYLILFYPSLLLYSSLALRDLLIIVLMIASAIHFIDKNYFRSVVIILPLFFLKFQNFYLMIIFFSIFLIFDKKSFFYKFRYFLISLFALCFIYYLDNYLFALNRYRMGFFVENAGNANFYQSIDGLLSLLVNSLISSSYFLMKPFPWQAQNSFQLIQSFENILILLFLIIFTFKAYLKDKFITNKWLFFFIISLATYGIIVFNFGTAARYKFSLVLFYVIGLSYEIFKIYGYNFILKIKKIDLKSKLIQQK